jgi:hypothetical protein
MFGDGLIKPHDARILVVDIERLPGLARLWEQKTRFVPIRNFTRLPSLLCFAAKWHGQRKVEFHAAWDDAEAMVLRSWELYDQADVVIGYNSVRFDNKHLRGDWLLAGLPPPAPWKDVDLYKVNSATFNFESKSLDHLCRILGLDTKAGHYSMDMAEACMDGDARAQRTMRRYNIGDVKITEQAYDRLLAWIKTHPHLTNLGENDEPTCNRCASTDLQRLPTTYLAVQIRYVLWRCNNCHGLVRGGIHSRAAKTQGV